MIEYLAWFTLILNFGVNLYRPFLIGKPAPPWNPSMVTAGWLFFCIVTLPICGRVLGWW